MESPAEESFGACPFLLQAPQNYHLPSLLQSQNEDLRSQRLNLTVLSYTIQCRHKIQEPT
jgi:hypothetical protein